jgi:1,4-dihydroxy-2-naphthoate octaprenyltransferase
LSRLVALARLARPQFLLGGAVLHGLGVAMALGQGHALSVSALLWGQLAVTAAQLLTHFSNDYFDRQADALHPAKPLWSGGSGVLPSGAVPPRWALAAALVSALVAVAAAVRLATVIRPGAMTAWLLGGAIFLAWSYSSPPLRLHGTGIGEFLGAFLLAILTPLTGYHLQGGAMPGGVTLLLVPLWCLQLGMLITVSLPDAASDEAAGKRTLAVRIGPRLAAGLAMFAYASAYLNLPALIALGAPRDVGMAYAVWAPLALWQTVELYRGAGTDPRRWDRLSFGSIALVVGSALAVGWVVAHP